MDSAPVGKSIPEAWMRRMRWFLSEDYGGQAVQEEHPAQTPHPVRQPRLQRLASRRTYQKNDAEQRCAQMPYLSGALRRQCTRRASSSAGVGAPGRAFPSSHAARWWSRPGFACVGSSCESVHCTATFILCSGTQRPSLRGRAEERPLAQIGGLEGAGTPSFHSRPEP